MAKTTKIDAVTLTGNSGRQYDFRIYVWDTKFKALAGVYVVAARTVDPGQPARYEALFVGMGGDLSKVLANHPRSECFQMYLANVIGILRQDDAAERAAIVADLVDGLSPPCNAADAV